MKNIYKESLFTWVLVLFWSSKSDKQIAEQQKFWSFAYMQLPFLDVSSVLAWSYGGEFRQRSSILIASMSREILDNDWN